MSLLTNKICEYYRMVFHTDNGKIYVEHLPIIGYFNGVPYNQHDKFIMEFDRMSTTEKVYYKNECDRNFNNLKSKYERLKQSYEEEKELIEFEIRLRSELKEERYQEFKRRKLEHN